MNECPPGEVQTSAARPPGRRTSSRWREVAAWWPVVLSPLAVAGAYALRAAGLEAAIAKEPHEVAAPVILSAAVLVCAVRWLVRRDRLHLVLTVLAAALLCREIHFPGTHRGIYVAGAIIALWCVLWRKSLIKQVWRTAKGRWLTVAVWSYFVSLLIQRRALKFLPDETMMHIRLEEVTENVAHLLFLIAALV